MEVIEVGSRVDFSDDDDDDDDDDVLWSMARGCGHRCRSIEKKRHRR
jgi:hypothetical protein